MSLFSQRRQLVLRAASALLLPAASIARPQVGAARKAKLVPVDGDDTPDAVTYGGREDVVRFADAVAERRGLDAAWLKRWLEQARFQPAVARLIMPTATGTAKNWSAYRARFVEPVRIRGGVAFWQANERWLAQAEALYGVPAEIVVGIVGVESIYGRQMGNFRVLDALATLAFDFPTGRKDRSEFFQGELESWFVVCQSLGLAPTSWLGSYAGAFGMAQFMPSSFNRFGVDFDGDGHVDLHTSAADAVGSVANYLAEFGWKRGLATHFDVTAPNETSERALLLGPDIVPTFSAEEMIEHGALLADAARHADSRLAFVELQNGAAAPSYVAGTSNFFAITRYNRSSYYAMAVVALGEALRRNVSGASARG